MPQVYRGKSVRDDLLAIGRQIAEESQNLEIALRFLDRIDEKCQLYATRPHMGRSRPDLADSVRSFPIDSYVVMYRPAVDGIEVLMVVHGSRDYPSLAKTRLGNKNQ